MDGIAHCAACVQPQFSRRDTASAFQWRIRNLPYAPDVYSVTVDDDAQQIVVRTTNKKCAPPALISLPLKQRSGRRQTPLHAGCCNHVCVQRCASKHAASARNRLSYSKLSSRWRRAQLVVPRRYFKRISVPELDAMELHLEAGRLRWQHAHNTLVVSYTKPDEVRAAEEMEKCGLKSIEGQGIVPAVPGGEPSDCKQQ